MPESCAGSERTHPALFAPVPSEDYENAPVPSPISPSSMPDYEPPADTLPPATTGNDLLHSRFSSALEEKFRIYLREDLRYVPWLMLGALIIVIVQGVLDRDSLSPEAYAAVTQARIHTLVPVIVTWILVSALSPAPRIAPLITLLLSLALGSSLFYMELVAWQAGSYRPYQTMLLAIFFFQFVNITATWRDRCLVGLILLLLFAVVEGQILSGTPYVRHLLFMTCAWAAGSACAYILDQSTRQAFLRNQRRQALADTDPLTGLSNRRQLAQRFSRLWRQARRESKTIALAMIDVDHFKAYNDHYGHIAGDGVLHQVASTLQQLMNRPFDFVARYGGEEFTAIWYNIAPENLPDLGNDLCRAVELLNIEHAKSPCQHVTISAGIAWQTPGSQDQPGQLFTVADQMLYAAKREGRNQVQVFDPERALPESEKILDDPPPLPQDTQKRPLPAWLTVFSSSLRLNREQVQQMHQHHLQQSIARLHAMSVLIFLVTAVIASQNYFAAPSPDALHISLLQLLVTCVVLLAALACSSSAFFHKWLHHIILFTAFAVVCTCNITLWAGWHHGLPFPYESMQILTLLMYFAGTQSLRSTFIISLINTLVFILIVLSQAPPFFPVHEAIACTVGPNALGIIVVWMLEQKLITSFLAYQDIERLSRTDELTGLYNRHIMFENLAQIFDHAIAEHKELAIAILDIDYFKRYNDNYGHAGGDAVLEKIGQTLQNQARRGLDFAARYGGEEFVLVWYNVTPHAATRLAEQTRMAVEALNIPHKFSPIGHVSVSIGLAWGAPGEGLNRERALLAQADKALYQAKRAGRNRLEIAPYLFQPHPIQNHTEQNASASPA